MNKIIFVLCKLGLVFSLKQSMFVRYTKQNKMKQLVGQLTTTAIFHIFCDSEHICVFAESTL